MKVEWPQFMDPESVFYLILCASVWCGSWNQQDLWSKLILDQAIDCCGRPDSENTKQQRSQLTRYQVWALQQIKALINQAQVKQTMRPKKAISINLVHIQDYFQSAKPKSVKLGNRDSDSVFVSHVYNQSLLLLLRLYQRLKTRGNH